jgi:hypothetical protein
MANPAQSSGLRSADAAILARSGRLLGVQLISDNTNAATVVLYDHASAASGTEIAKLTLKAGESSRDCTLPAEGIDCLNGIYADVTGTGAAYIVYYSVA